jgi:hypothetical protein
MGGKHMASGAVVASSRLDDAPHPGMSIAHPDLIHDLNNDVGVAIGVLDAISDSAELSADLRRLAEGGLQRLLHAQEMLRALRGLAM